MDEKLKLPWWNEVLTGSDESDLEHYELMYEVYSIGSLKHKKNKKNDDIKTAWKRKG